jgi:hypothetical protein
VIIDSLWTLNKFWVFFRCPDVNTFEVHVVQGIDVTTQMYDHLLENTVFFSIDNSTAKTKKCKKKLSVKIIFPQIDDAKIFLFSVLL